MKDRAASAFIALLAVVIHKALSEKLSKHNGWRGGVTVAVPFASPPHQLETPSSLSYSRPFS